jgi:hypothetical protein
MHCLDKADRAIRGIRRWPSLSLVIISDRECANGLDSDDDESEESQQMSRMRVWW